jgi:hypothetical protein
MLRRSSEAGCFSTVHSLKGCEAAFRRTPYSVRQFGEAGFQFHTEGGN